VQSSGGCSRAVDEMFQLLSEIIRERKANAVNYGEYLNEGKELMGSGSIVEIGVKLYSMVRKEGWNT